MQLAALGRWACLATLLLGTAAQDALNGTLFRYSHGILNVAFMTGNFPRHFILVGGLTDDFFVTSYVQLLTERLNDMRWSMVQPLLASSGTGYGTSSLDDDAYQLDQLAEHLASFYNSQGIVMMGHSTGCQDTVRYVQRGYGVDPHAAPLLGAILQAPVSDREYRERYVQDTASDLARADAMIAAGQGDDILKREKLLRNTPITANRFHALAARGGDDDMFSSDLSDADLQRILSPLAAVPTLFILGGNDSTVPSNVDIPLQGRRFAAAVGPSAQSVVVPGGDHSLYGFEHEAVDDVMALMARVNSSARGAARR